MTERVLPPGAVCTGSSPEFDATTVPEALLREHHTRPGTYGRLRILDGALRYVGAGDPVELAAGDDLVILPDEAHRVEPAADARFVIEFFEVPQCS